MISQYFPIIPISRKRKRGYDVRSEDLDLPAVPTALPRSPCDSVQS